MGVQHLVLETRLAVFCHLARFHLVLAPLGHHDGRLSSLARETPSNVRHHGRPAATYVTERHGWKKMPRWAPAQRTSGGRRNEGPRGSCERTGNAEGTFNHEGRAGIRLNSWLENPRYESLRAHSAWRLPPFARIRRPQGGASRAFCLCNRGSRNRQSGYSVGIRTHQRKQ